MTTPFDTQCMQRALELARRGEGLVEPNPMVGCVIVDGRHQIVGEGWHQRFGGPHAEVEALRQAGEAARGGCLYVTLEPCCHQGKTPPCTDAIVSAGLTRVVMAQRDPFGQVDGGGIRELTHAGISLEIGLLEHHARHLNAPYHKLQTQKRPWVIAKWAMTLDGKLATRESDSKWISHAEARDRVHQLRGRVDGILVGRQTAEDDDPLLTARPAGVRIATRIILDSQARISPESQLVQTAHQAPVLLAVGPEASQADTQRHVDAGCEVWSGSSSNAGIRLEELLDELGRRQLTNLLVEGGSRVFGSLFDLRAVDEVHVFIAPKFIGGDAAPSPVAGLGRDQMSLADQLVDPEIEILAHDNESNVYIHGRLR